MKRNVVLVQVNFQYGDNVFVPYAVGSIQAYSESFPEIRSKFQFYNPVFLREDPADVVFGMEKPSVVGISCYLWNWEYNKLLAKKIRQTYPKCLIVFGGTQVPDRSDGFFEEHPYVDILVHQEGEIAFKDILLESLKEEPDYRNIPGLSVKVCGEKTHKTSPSLRIRDLSILPSPYTSGVFDFMVNLGFRLNVTNEGDRGCPYKCTFCDWGGSTFSKLSQFSEERIISEFEWFARSKVEYVFNADANFGILPRDVDLIRKLIEIRRQHDGFPVGFRMCTAKNAKERVFELVYLLNEAGMNKGATLSFQSMDAETLRLIKRENIKMDDFNHWMNAYAEKGIATYTELIMGMPGETYSSTKFGIDVLFNEQAHAINLYAHACTALPNSEMSDPLYVSLHGIKTVKMPILLAHSTPDAGISEYHNVIIETRTMPHEEWLRSYMFYWAIQCFHCLGLTKHISIFLHKELNLKYSDFYDQFMEHFLLKSGSFIGKEISLTLQILKDAVKGGRLDRVSEEFGNLYWPLEEMSFLTFVKEKGRFYKEVEEFLIALCDTGQFGEKVDKKILCDLVQYQSAILKEPFCKEVVVDLQYDFQGYFTTGSLSDIFSAQPIRLTARGEAFRDVAEYAQKIVWYGRRGGKFHSTDVSIEFL
jgi:putative methyltransferase